MPYLTDLSQICGDVLAPLFWVVGCFLPIALGLWTAMNTGWASPHAWRPARRCRFSYRCFQWRVGRIAVGDYGSPSVGMAGPSQALLEPWRARN